MTFLVPGQTRGLQSAASPAASHAGLPGAQVAPPAGVLGDGIVPTPAAARCASSGEFARAQQAFQEERREKGRKKDLAIRQLVSACRLLREFGYARSTLLRMVKAVWNQQNREASQGRSFSPASPPIGDYSEARR